MKGGKVSFKILSIKVRFKTNKLITLVSIRSNVFFELDDDTNQEKDIYLNSTLNISSNEYYHKVYKTYQQSKTDEMKEKSTKDNDLKHE